MDARLGSPGPVPTSLNSSVLRSSGVEERNKMTRGREIFISRILKAILWNVALQCVLVSCVIFVVNVDIFHPYKWIQQTWKVLASFGTWFNLIPLAVIAFVKGVVLSRDYVVGIPCVKTRFGVFCSVFQPKNLVMTVVNMLSGIILVLYYSYLFGDDVGVLTKVCYNSSGNCLNEKNMFLFVGGLWIGLYTSIKCIIWETHIVIFPLVHQLKYPQVKNQLSHTIRKALSEAIPPTFYLLLMYAWLEGFLREHLSGFLGIAIDKDALKSLWAWIHLSLIVKAYLFSFQIILSGFIMKLLFQIFISEYYHFPISRVSNDGLTLCEALASPLPLLQQLGCLDILHVAERDPLRRRELFSLSLPGGHPHNWNGISCELLKALGAFTLELNSAASDMNRAANGPLLPTPSSDADQSLTRNTTFLSPPPPTAFSSKSQLSPTGLRMRNMSLLHSPRENDSFISRSPASQLITVASGEQRKSALEAFKIQVCCLLEWIRRKPGINLLFGEMEDARARYLLLHSQHLTWAAQALALLTAASLTKDNHGVVQKDIPAIIKALLNLKNALDRLPLYSHKRSLRLDAVEIRMKAALSSSVKRSLYILCEAFGQYLYELPIPEDVRQQLCSFVSFKEG